MKKLLEKRKSLGTISLVNTNNERMMEATPPSPARRKSSLHGLGNFFPPSTPSAQRKSSVGQRRYSFANLFSSASAPLHQFSFSDLDQDSESTRNERDYLPGIRPVYDSTPVSYGFARGADSCCTLVLTPPRWCPSLSSVSPPSPTPCMGRAMRVVVCGPKKVGKTAILRQVACMEDITTQPYSATLDDTYQVLLEEADRPREILIFHDTAGLPDYAPVDMKRPYLQVADAFVLVYSIADHESFNRVDLLKKHIEKQFGKEKKEVPIVILGNMRDLQTRKVDSEFAHAWAARERVKLFEVSAKDRNTLVDFVHFLGQRHFHPIKESKFSLSKKLKPEKSAAIMMDF